MESPRKKKTKSTAVRMSNNLHKAVDEFLKTEKAQNAGYDDKKEVVEAAVRRLLEYYGFIETLEKETE